MKTIATVVFALGWVAATLYTYSKSEAQAADASHEAAVTAPAAR